MMCRPALAPALNTLIHSHACVHPAATKQQSPQGASSGAADVCMLPQHHSTLHLTPCCHPHTPLQIKVKDSATCTALFRTDTTGTARLPNLFSEDEALRMAARFNMQPPVEQVTLVIDEQGFATMAPPAAQ